jgi:hypothetical protein
VLGSTGPAGKRRDTIQLPSTVIPGHHIPINKATLRKDYPMRSRISHVITGALLTGCLLTMATAGTSSALGAEADLSVYLEAVPGTYAQGPQGVPYKLTITNNGPNEDGYATVTTSFQETISNSAKSSYPGGCELNKPFIGQDTLTCPVGALAANSSRTMEFTIFYKARLLSTNIATVSKITESEAADPNNTNNGYLAECRVSYESVYCPNPPRGGYARSLLEAIEERVGEVF